MKIFKYILSLATAALLVQSCTDPELGPVVTFETATIGAYVRFVSQEGNAEFDLANASSSKFSYCVDFVSLDDGARVSEYVVEAQFFDNTPANGDNSKARTEFISVPSSSFATSAKGNPGTCVDVSLSAVLSSLGLSLNQVSAGDQFSLFGKVKTDDGGEYSSNNTTATVRGSAFQGFFDVNVTATCPLPATRFVGSYALTYEGSAGTGYGLPFPPQTVTLSTVAGSSTQRTFSSVFLTNYNFGPFPAFIDFVCDKVDFLSLQSNVGCGQGNIGLGPVKDANGFNVSPAVDITNDASFKVILNEGFNSGGCSSVTPTETTLVFTKL
jgi:hypothetical protein